MGANMAQCTLGDSVIVEVDIAPNRVRQMLPRLIAVRCQDIGDAPIEALDHVIGLRMMGPD